MNELSRPPSLPATTEALLACRKIKSAKTVHDHVEMIHERLWRDEDYRSVLEALDDDESAEGMVEWNDIKAAEMIREFAKKDHNPVVAELSLAKIVSSLHTVLRRYGLGREQRKAAMANGHGANGST